MGPTGIELIKQAVYAIDAAKQKIADAEAALARARGEHAAAEENLAKLVASGACITNGCTHEHHATTNGVQPVTNGTTNGVPSKVAAVTLKKTQPKFAALENKDMKIVWRIAFQLLADPVVDYAAYGERLWGPDVPFKTVKNRLSTNLAYLCKENIGVAEALGSNTYRINKAKLAEKSRLPVPEAAS